MSALAPTDDGTRAASRTPSLAPSLHEALRADTAAAHASLERDLDWEARVGTREGYRGLLARLYGFHAAYEPAIGAALGDEAFLSPRRRLDAAARDLAHLGATPAAVAALPAPAPVALSGPAAAMGALYVLEGSTLGGAVIGRTVSRLHGFAPETGLAYYAGRGRATGPLWIAFRARLEAIAADATARAATRDAANATFDAMRLWLCAAP